MRRLLTVLLCLLAFGLPAAAQPAPGANRILAVVNGDVITQSEVVSRTRLFALNVGTGLSPEALARLQPQVLRLLVEERLRLQEVQRRGILVSDQDILEAVTDIERRNNLRPGALVANLRGIGIQPRVFYDQIRAQIGWGRLLRASLGPRGEVSEQDVAEALAARRARAGQPEFLVAEIYIPVDEAGAEAETGRFVEDVIAQLRRGSPFPVVATQFSQSQSALQGGDLGWVTVEQLDPEVAAVVTRMPAGAISNPIRVPGGFQIVTLRGRRESGATPGGASTMVSLRQVFLPFAERLDPQAPTEQQRQVLERAQRIQATARGCEAMDALPRTSDRPVNPGDVRLEAVNPPQLRQLLASLPPGRTSQPLVSPDGITLIMVCGRERREAEDAMTPDLMRQIILRERAELLARQLQRELRRRAIIDLRA